MQMPKQILVICDDTPSSYSADNGQMKDNPQQICDCEGRLKTTMCVFVHMCVGAYVCALTCRSDEEVQDFCSAGKLF